MSKPSVSLVSYWNTRPFLYGLKHYPKRPELEIQLDIPSVCGEKLINRQVDIALVPVAALHRLKDYRIITDYCIGCNGSVGSVCLFSDVPLEQVDTVILDYQSMTSVQLVQLLLREYWHVSPKLVKGYEGYRKDIGGKTAGLVIGDRAFEMFKRSAYVYDLGEHWKLFTGLPFVFAAWISLMQPDPVLENAFNEALKYGLSNMEKVVLELRSEVKSEFDIADYLHNKLDFDLNSDKRKALKVFMSKIRENKLLLQS